MIFKIGSHVIQPGLVLAPMAGTTNHPFRLLAKEQGCRLLYSEMISAKGLLSNEKRAQHLLYFTEEERPLGFQLFGSEPEIMARAAQKLEELGVDFIDLNLGCPARKIIRQGEGGALMREPKR
ncbi:MAG TPA: tRNA-dihydrouridine synthase family protein, partial [Candidatus Limnocylindrales bacterium]|nr:tRNA-dihydrouridine synthase family protein [Candidatus Limnocylindrales bacterium]